MIRGIIFDCFGVLYEGSLGHLASLAPVDRRAEVYDVNRSADYGYISHEEYLAAMAQLIGRGPEDVERISRQLHVRNEELVAFVMSLRPRYKTALLSNVGQGVMETLFSEDDRAKLFDAVVLSGEAGMAKPHPEIYELTASRLGLRTDECVMVDDLTKNAEGAEAVGMKGIVYSSVGQLQVDLRRLMEGEEVRA